MNSINRSNNATHKPRLIILERNAIASEHAKTVAMNAQLVNPDVQITKINERSDYYRPSDKRGLKHRIQSNLRGWFKGHLKSL